MRKLLKKNQKIYMVPQDIKGALSTKIKKVSRNVIEVEVNNADLQYYQKDAIVEMFTVVDEGMLYFKPVVSEIFADENVVKVVFNKEVYDLLQRREFTRVELEKDFRLSDGQNDYVCSLVDISAGGMRFLTDAPLTTVRDYVIEFSLENNIPIQCFFKPIRVDELQVKATKTKKQSPQSIVSGRFIALKNIDKIAIVQFCFKKQMEFTNK